MVQNQARSIFLATENFADTLTSLALASNQHSWPFITLPHFEIMGTNLNDLTKSLMIGFAPLITSQTIREQWEIFATYNQQWIQDGVNMNLQLHQNFSGSLDNIDSIHREIFWTDDNIDNVETNYVITNQKIANNTDGPWLPVWQFAPAPHNPVVVNYDLFNNKLVTKLWSAMVTAMQPVLSENTHLEFLYDGSVYDDPTHPHSLLLQPIYNNFVTIDDTRDVHEQNTEAHIVGAVFAVLPWDKYFQNIMPPKTTGTSNILEGPFCCF